MWDCSGLVAKELTDNYWTWALFDSSPFLYRFSNTSSSLRLSFTMFSDLSFILGLNVIFSSSGTSTPLYFYRLSAVRMKSLSSTAMFSICGFLSILSLLSFATLVGLKGVSFSFLAFWASYNFEILANLISFHLYRNSISDTGRVVSWPYYVISGLKVHPSFVSCSCSCSFVSLSFPFYSSFNFFSSLCFFYVSYISPNSLLTTSGLS